MDINFGFSNYLNQFHFSSDDYILLLLFLSAITNTNNKETS